MTKLKEVTDLLQNVKIEIDNEEELNHNECVLLPDSTNFVSLPEYQAVTLEGSTAPINTYITEMYGKQVKVTVYPPQVCAEYVRNPVNINGIFN